MDLNEISLLVQRGNAKKVKELVNLALEEKIDAVILTGGMAYSKMLTDMIRKRIERLVPVEVLAGENEMEALAYGGLRILRGEEKAKTL